MCQSSVIWPFKETLNERLQQPVEEIEKGVPDHNPVLPYWFFWSNIWKSETLSLLRSQKPLISWFYFNTQRLTRQTGRKTTVLTASLTASRVWATHHLQLLLPSIAARSFHADHWSHFTCNPSPRYRKNHQIYFYPNTWPSTKKAHIMVHCCRP